MFKIYVFKIYKYYLVIQEANLLKHQEQEDHQDPNEDHNLDPSDDPFVYREIARNIDIWSHNGLEVTFDGHCCILEHFGDLGILDLRILDHFQDHTLQEYCGIGDRSGFHNDLGCLDLPCKKNSNITKKKSFHTLFSQLFFENTPEMMG